MDHEHLRMIDEGCPHTEDSLCLPCDELSPEEKAELDRLYEALQQDVAASGGIWPVYTDDGFEEPCGSCDICGVNLYPGDEFYDGELCEQCQWYAEKTGGDE